MSAPSQLSWRQTLDPLSSLSAYDSRTSRAASPILRPTLHSRPSRIPGAGAPRASQDAPPTPVFKVPALPALNEHPDMPNSSLLPSIPSPRNSFNPLPSSIPMTPSSSLGLPSPTFPPRKLPPIPPRSPARPATADIPSATSSRRNSWQVSVRLASSRAQRAGAFIQLNQDILAEGDFIGEGIELRGEKLRAVHVPSSPRDPCQLPSAKFQVIRKLGSGSYAVVFLVREIISGYEAHRASNCSTAEEMPAFGDFEGLDQPRMIYGREFAIKCLSKANLSTQELQVQMVEATIHQSLGLHNNIVTLHRTLETTSFLLLVLEYVPGEDLFYFLEQSRDNGEFSMSSPSSVPGLDFDDPEEKSDKSSSSTSTSPFPSSSSITATSALTNTPPTPSLLSSFHPSQILSHGRLRLIASMFSQMCDAVQACHAQGVSHRDIKPENFIVTDGYGRGADGKYERRVIVKLSDFGLATTDLDSTDMDCGSAPYMSYECRNNVGPTYATQPADIWSLGIVLINMLYHHNLWSDTCIGDTAFEQYRAHPVAFLMQRSPGMSQEVAEFLANRVFRILGPDSDSDVASTRVTAKEFGEWAKGLPKLMDPSHQSQSQSQSLAMTISPVIPPLTLKSPVLQDDEVDTKEEAAVSATLHFDQVKVDADVSATRSPSPPPPPSLVSRQQQHSPDCINRRRSGEDEDDEEDDATMPSFVDSEAAAATCAACLDDEIQRAAEGEDYSRTVSGVKRRKRGARKGKGATAANTISSPASPITSHAPLLPLPISSLLPLPLGQHHQLADNADDRLEAYAQGAQVLAREISRVSANKKSPTNGVLAPSSRPRSVERSRSRSRKPHGHDHSSPPVPPLPTSSPAIVKKPSKWNVFSRKENVDSTSTVDNERDRTEAAQNVSNIIKSLGPPGAGAPAASSSSESRQQTTSSSSTSSNEIEPNAGNWRGRRQEPRRASALPSDRPVRPAWERSDKSPAPSTISGYSARSSATSNSNWRQPYAPSTSGTSSSASSMYTRFSNGSERSVSTMATSVSASSNFSLGANGGVLNQQLHDKKSHSKTSVPAPNKPLAQKPPRHLPSNVKHMQGVPWALDELPRQCHPHVNGQMPQGDIFGGPPVRRRKPQPKPALGTISEQPKTTRAPRQPSPLSSPHQIAEASESEHDADQPKKVQKGQINTLAKMLSALKTNRGRD